MKKEDDISIPTAYVASQDTATAGGTFADSALHGDTLVDAARWPTTLRVLSRLMSCANQPMFVTWGPERRLLYNDQYAELLGARHPNAFRKPFFEVWGEVINEVAPIMDRAYAGQPTTMEDIELWIYRGGQRREAHFSFSFTPVRDEAGQVVGVFCVCSEITEKIFAQRLLAEESERHSRLFEQAPGFICVLRGPDHIFEFANRAYSSLIGGRHCVGLALRDVLPEIQAQGFVELLDQVYVSGERFIAKNMRARLRRSPDAPIKEVFLDFVYEPILDATGRVTGIFVEGQDVTAAHLAQQAEEQINARYKSLVGSMSEGFLILDDAFRVLEINAEGVRIDGRPAHEIIGKTHWELWPASVGTPIEAAFRQAMTQRSAIALQHHYVTDANDIWVDMRIYPVTGGVGCFYRDISTFKQADTALAQSNERFRAAVQAIGVMWTNDAAGRMVGEQPAWAALTGQSQEAYQGYGWSNAVHPDDALPTIEAWQHAVAIRSTFIFEHRVLRSDGEWRLFAIRAVPILTIDGAVREWVGVHVDITEAKKDAEALREADRRKDEFLAILAHELRNPLAPIRTAAQVLATPSLSQDHLSWCHEVISRQAQHMTWLLDDLLDVSRITSGRFQLKKDYVRLDAVVDAALETAGPIIERKRHSLEVILPSQPVDLEVDSLRLSQVLTNLLTNAAKYTDEGGNIRLHAGVDSDGVVISVRDDGIGLAPESLTRIFGMFSQVGTVVDRAEGGLGIGLALARGLVELHGGRIDAQSAGLGQGTVFTVRLPSNVLARSARATSDADTHDNAATATMCSVLIADDNCDAADSLALLLRLEGYEVDTVNGGLSALEACGRLRPQVALLDVGMPDMSGYEVARRVRREAWGRGILLVAITGWGQEDDKREAIASGFDHHLTKPIDPPTLTKMLVRWSARTGNTNVM